MGANLVTFGLHLFTQSVTHGLRQ